MPQIILASSSKRRREILEDLGLEFEVVPPNVDETVETFSTIIDFVEKVALKKALAVAKKYSKGLIIGADTIVEYQGKLIGKPKSKKEIIQMLEWLGGTEHRILTGVAVVDAATGNKFVTSAETWVKLRKLPPKIINKYANRQEAYHLAGAYDYRGISAIFVEGIKGDYYNVLGLPLAKLHEALSKFRFDITETWK
jgi:septum formation protein